VRLALIQMDVKDGNTEANVNKLKKLTELVEADLYVTPELSLTGFEGFIREEDVEALLKDLPCVGVGFREESTDGRFNAYVIACNGEIIYKRRKYMLFSPMKEDVELKKGQVPSPFQFKGLNLSVIICYELRFPELFWPLAKEVHAFLVPAAWPESRAEAWMTLIKARSIENLSYVVGVNRWGGGKYGPFAGESVFAKPDGSSVTLGKGVNVIAVEMDLREIEESRQFPSFRDRARLTPP